MSSEPYQTKSVISILAGMFVAGLVVHVMFLPRSANGASSEKRSQGDAEVAVVSTGQFDQWLASPQWPGFRGGNRDSRQRDSVISADWEGQPPELLWKIEVGEGYSSFAVAGELLFTQQLRDDSEVVVCYKADTGAEVWSQQVDERFTDSGGDSDTRATPTVAGDGLYVMGAGGIVMRLDARTGQVIWQQNLQEVAERTPPMFGFCSSPLVTDSAVIVHAGGADDKGIFAFDLQSGQIAWSSSCGDHSYCSPQPCSIAGESLVMLSSNAGLQVFDVKTGKTRLDYSWPQEDHRSLQPQFVDGNSIVIPSETGTRRIRVSTDSEQWTAEEVWTSRDLKPVYNDFVVHQGHAFGFDDTVFTCVDLETGEATWKQGRYGKGQVVLLETSGLLLVAEEQGGIVLLNADPAAHTEVAKIEGIEGRTFNHPVVVGDRLYLRNSTQAACYRLPLINDEG